MTQPTACRLDRTHVLSIVLALASLQDVALTLVGLATQRGASEINPFAAFVLHHGLIAAIALKAAGLTIALLAARALANHGYAKRAERTLGAWSAVYVAINAFSLVQILGGI